ncbi:hypothetical protein BK809_0006687 [Diplodia seriata]|uniref:BZIP domain-containing protein n=1 Tax=Diplodia seriata TaxID=420778 RepID=A0A1S8B497_9PEZI|nr:hypothetical protein BK809_0006687 [Diplodia seriata]
MGSESEERPTTKKRARQSTPSAEPSSKGKKQRGRPKVDTQDETAADRRRTQIRLAQRAYRQRKEMTISSLQKQVEQLQSVIDGMNNSFLHFNDQAMASDIFALRPHLASELRSTTEAFVNLSKTAKTVEAEDEREDSQEASDPSTTPQKAEAAPNISSQYDLEEYGGEWLDSQDVEGYLEELGVHIDAQASFAETAVRTLDAIARAQPPHGDVAHPDSEMGVLGEALDQFAPNHVGGNFSMSPPSQALFATGSPGQASLPSSSSAPSASQGENTTSNGPSTPDSANLLQQTAQRLDQACTMDWGEFPSADPKNWDEWDRFYDLNFAWADNNQADLSEYGMGGVATVGSVEERRQNRSVTIDVQRFINGKFGWLGVIPGYTMWLTCRRLNQTLCLHRPRTRFPSLRHPLRSARCYHRSFLKTTRDCSTITADLQWVFHTLLSNTSLVRDQQRTWLPYQSYNENHHANACP